MKSSKLSFKINAVILLTCVLVSVPYIMILHHFETNRYRRSIEKIEMLMEATLRQRYDDLANMIAFNLNEAVELTFANMLKVKGLISAEVFDKDEMLSYSARKLGPDDPSDRIAPLRRQQFYVDAVSFSQSILYYTEPIIIIQRTVGYVRLGYALNEVEAERRMAIGLFTVLLATMLSLVFIILKILLAKYVTRPVSILHDIMKHIDDESLNTSVSLASHDEIGEMAQAFNDMTRRLRFTIEAFKTGYRQLEIEVTERKKAEKELQKARAELEQRVEERTAELIQTNRELESTTKLANAAARAKSEFLANMSHEIRTPLNGILVAADLILDENINPKQNRLVKIIHSSASSLMGIINDILDFSKIEAGKLELNIIPFHLERLMDNVVYIFVNQCSEKGLELLVNISPDVPKILLGDEFRIQQVLVNLVGNAFKFTDKGHILIQVSRLKQQWNKATLMFSVTDTGCGVAEEKLEGLFSPFTQVDASTTRKYGGTGLGLSICKRLVELMNGNILAESAPGQGSVFSFTIEFDALPSNQLINAVVPKDIISGWALIIDDNAESLMISRSLLESFGYHVETAESGKKGLNILESAKATGRRFDLILLDWLMPGMDGIETADAIRAKGETDIPIIMITAFGKEDVQKSAEAHGIKAFLTKPISQSLLFNTIMEVLGKEHQKIPSYPQRKHLSSPAILNRLKGLNVMVVEDNPTNQEIVLLLLTQAGMRPMVAKTGKEGVLMAQTNPFDVILMDVQMPEMDGFEATKILRQIPGLKNLPIIAMTAHAMKGDAEKCLAAGMDGYTAKPINRDQLFREIWKLLKHRRTVSAEPSDQSEVPEAENIVSEPPDIIHGIHHAVMAINTPHAKDLSRLSLILARFYGALKSADQHLITEHFRELERYFDPKLLAELSRNIKSAEFETAVTRLKDIARQIGLPVPPRN